MRVARRKIPVFEMCVQRRARQPRIGEILPADEPISYKGSLKKLSRIQDPVRIKRVFEFQV